MKQNNIRSLISLLFMFPLICVAQTFTFLSKYEPNSISGAAGFAFRAQVTVTQTKVDKYGGITYSVNLSDLKIDASGYWVAGTFYNCLEHPEICKGVTDKDFYIAQVALIDNCNPKGFGLMDFTSSYQVKDNVSSRPSQSCTPSFPSGIILKVSTSLTVVERINLYLFKLKQTEKNKSKQSELPSLNATSSSSSRNSSANSSSSSSSTSSSRSTSSSSGSSGSRSSSSSSSGGSNSSSGKTSSSSSSSRNSEPHYDPELFKSDEQKKQEAMGNLFLTTYNSVNELAEEISQNRERKQAQREREQAIAKAEYEKFMSKVKAEKLGYLELVSKYDNNLRNKHNFYDNITSRLHNVINAPSIPWSIFIANVSFSELFGKNIDYVHKKINRCCTHLRKQISKGDINNFNGISSQFQKYVDVEQENLFFWYNGEFEIHYTLNLLFDENDIMTGLEVELDTDNINSKKYINQYLEDLKVALADDYIQLSGNTFLTKDKLFVLDFNFLRMYDLNYFKPDTHLAIDENSFVNSWGLKLKGDLCSKQDMSKSKVVVTEVVPKSLAEKSKLVAGDVILKVDNIEVSKPYEIEMYILGAKSKQGISIEVERNNKIETLIINL